MNAFVRDGAVRSRKRHAGRKTKLTNVGNRIIDKYRRSLSSAAVRSDNDTPIVCGEREMNSSVHVSDEQLRHGRPDDQHDAINTNDNGVVGEAVPLLPYLTIDLTATEDSDDVCGHNLAAGSSADEQPLVCTEREEDFSYPEDFMLAKEFIFDDFKKIDKFRVNQKLNDFLQNFDEDEKKHKLIKVFKQIYKESRGSLEISMKMLEQITSKSSVLAVNENIVNSPSEYEVQLPQHSHKDTNTSINIDRENKLNSRIRKKMLKLFGSSYLKSDEKLLLQSPISNLPCQTNVINIDPINVESEILEDENIIDLDTRNDGPCSTTDNFGLTKCPKTTDSSRVVANPIICDDISIQSNSNFRNKSSIDVSSIMSYLKEVNSNEAQEENINQQQVMNSDTVKNVEIKNTSDKEKPKLKCFLTCDQILTKLESKICKFIDPNDNIFKNKTINELASYFSSTNFYCKFDMMWETTESKLIGELMVKLFEQFSNTKRNMAYLSGCLVYIFHEITIKSSYAPCEIKQHMNLFVDCIRKYAKQYDIDFWRKWFVTTLFSDWCFILACVFHKNANMIANLKDRPMLTNALEYFKKIKHCNYVFVNSHVKTKKPLSGIFEPTNSNDLLGIENVPPSEKISKTTTNASINENVQEACSVLEHPKIAVCSEFSLSNSFNNDFCCMKDNNKKSKESGPNKNNVLKISSQCKEVTNRIEVQNNPPSNVIDKNQPKKRINRVNGNNVEKTGTKRKNTELSPLNTYYTIGNNPQKFSIICDPQLPNSVLTQPLCSVNTSQPLNDLITWSTNTLNIQPPNVTNTQLLNATEMQSANVTINQIPSVMNTQPSNPKKSRPTYGTNVPSSNSMNDQHLCPQPSKHKKTRKNNRNIQIPNVINSTNNEPLNIMNSQNSVGTNSQYSNIMNSWPLNTMNPYSSKTQHPNIMTSQPTSNMSTQSSSAIIYSQNSLGINSQYMMNYQPTNIMNTQYSAVITSQPTNYINTRPQCSSAPSSQNSVQMNSQYSAILESRLSNGTFVQPNQSVPNEQHNTISNNVHNNNITHQFNLYNNVINYSNMNCNSNHNVISSLPNTHSANHGSTSSSQLTCCNYPPTVHSIPEYSNPSTCPVQFINTQSPPNSAQPLAVSSSSMNGNLPNHNYGNLRCPNNYNSSQSVIHHPVKTTEPINFQPPDYNSQVSPDLPDTQVPNMPNQQSSNCNDKLCMALDCMNISKYSCDYCFHAHYCSYKCQKSDWHYHKNECRQPVK